ncbi:HTD2 family dehydratase [Roseivivax sp. CAU 1753]
MVFLQATQEGQMGEDRITDWIGREETAEGGVSDTMARMMAATLSDTGVVAGVTGDVLPPLWHWTGFPPTDPMSALGHDGHPKLGGFLPPVGLPRRMWAGGDVTFVKPIHVGEPLSRRSVVENVVTKSGKAGPMVFVTVRHDVSGRDGLALRELHNIVYLELPTRYAPPEPVAPPADVIAERTVPMSNSLLFRFSACTFNAHRIHIDLDYVRTVEKYPDLVVHGPLQALLMAQLATDVRGRAPMRFRYRGVHPMFPDAPLRVLAMQGADDCLALCTARGDAHQGMTATALWGRATD